MRLYANIGSTHFFKHLISSIALQHSLMSFGRTEMYLTLPPPVYIVSSFGYFLKFLLIFYPFLATHMLTGSWIFTLPCKYYALPNNV